MHMQIYNHVQLPPSRNDPSLTTLERAFLLARSGRCASVTEIVRILRSEGYYQDQIEGRSLKKQLKALIQSARNSPA